MDRTLRMTGWVRSLQNRTGRDNRYWLSPVLAQYLRLSAKYAGSFLRLGRERFIVGQNALLPLSRCGAGKWMLDAGEYTMKRFAALYGMKFAGTATNRSEAAKLSKNI